MFTLAQVALALQQLHQFHVACYHNPLTMLVTTVLALITGLLGMYVWVSCPYRQACTSKVAMSMQLVNGMPLVFVERTVYVTQF